MSPVTNTASPNDNLSPSARPRVFVVRRLPAPNEAALRASYDAHLNPTDETYSLDRLVDAARAYDAIVPTVVDDVPAAIFDAPGRRVRIVANFGVGFDRIDLEAARRNGVVVTNTPGALTEDTADVAMMLLLAAARRASEGERQLRGGEWEGWRPTHLLGTRVNGATLGIVGFGRIGGAVARRAHRGFGMRVLYVNPRPPDPRAVLEASADEVTSLEELLAQSDFVSLHAPSRPDTRHMIDAARIARMRPGAILVNTARGDLVDESALADALERGHLAAAGLDVFEHEPQVSPRLLSLSNVVLLPHLGCATTPSRVAMGERMLMNLDAFFRGQSPPDRIA
jgi:lactate dehydrogenase-like 2-hydroxyacid dehydrogenase